MIRKLFSLFVITLFTASCGSSKNEKKEDRSPVRGGTEVNVSLAVNYLDTHPTLSGDGTRVAFISGRDPSGLLKAYSFNTLDAAPSAMRITTDDEGLGSETLAILSPDGQWVGIVNQAGKLSLKKFGDTAARFDLKSPEGVVVGTPVFSAGTEPMLVFVVKNGAVSKGYVAQLNAQGPKDSPVALDGFEDGEEILEFYSSGASMTLASKIRSQENATVTIKRRDFSSLSEAAAAKPNIFEHTLSGAMSEGFSVTSAGLMFVKKVIPPGSKSKSPKGDKATTTLVYLQNQASIIDFSSGSVTAIESEQFNVFQTSQSSDGKLALLRGSEYLSCTDFEGFASTAILRKNDGGMLRIVPYLSDKLWTFVSKDPCNKGAGEFDFKIIDARLSAEQANGRYSIVVVSWFKTDFEVRHFSFRLSSDGTALEDIRSMEVSANTLP